MKNLHLVLFASLLSIQTPVINYALANPSTIEAQEAEESELSAINFENMTEMKMEDVFAAPRARAKSKEEEYKNKFSNLKTTFFNVGSGRIVFSITGESDGQKTHVASYVWKSGTTKSKDTKAITIQRYIDRITPKLNISSASTAAAPVFKTAQDTENEQNWYNSAQSPAKKEITTGNEPAIPTQEQRDAWKKADEQKEQSRMLAEARGKAGEDFAAEGKRHVAERERQQKLAESQNIIQEENKRKATEEKEKARQQQKAKQAQDDANERNSYNKAQSPAKKETTKGNEPGIPTQEQRDAWKKADEQKEQSRMLAEARGKAGEDFAAEGKRHVAERERQQKLAESQNIIQEGKERKAAEEKEKTRLALIEQQKTTQQQEEAKWWSNTQAESRQEKSRILAKAIGEAEIKTRTILNDIIKAQMRLETTYIDNNGNPVAYEQSKNIKTFTESLKKAEESLEKENANRLKLGLSTVTAPKGLSKAELKTINKKSVVEYKTNQVLQQIKNLHQKLYWEEQTTFLTDNNNHIANKKYEFVQTKLELKAAEDSLRALNKERQKLQLQTVQAPKYRSAPELDKIDTSTKTAFNDSKTAKKPGNAVPSAQPQDQSDTTQNSAGSTHLDQSDTTPTGGLWSSLQGFMNNIWNTFTSPTPSRTQPYQSANAQNSNTPTTASTASSSNVPQQQNTSSSTQPQSQSSTANTQTWASKTNNGNAVPTVTTITPGNIGNAPQPNSTHSTQSEAQLRNFEKQTTAKSSNKTRTTMKSGNKVLSSNDKEEDKYASVVSSGNSELSR